ncbi:MAG TPA: 2-oxoglutarate dehydrogenase E1 component [Chromatiales bacterium]|nr:2-oxoglutarate dehydrogenase E1 component [Chromatiales bacterium]
MNKKIANSSLQQQRVDAWLEGDNSAWLENLYESWLLNPDSVSERWRDYFSDLPRVNGEDSIEAIHSEVRQYFRNRPGQPDCSGVIRDSQQILEQGQKQTRVLQLINSYRFMGHLQANINPLYPQPTTMVPELTLEYHQLGKADLSRQFNTGSLVAPAQMPLADILEQLQQTYCGSIGAEYMHITNTDEKRWIQQHFESVRGKPEYTPGQRRYILDRLTAAETLERFLHTKYVGQKRFSLEGSESLIPLVDELIQDAGANGVKEIVIGMAHRGRLNVLVNILGKSPSLLFQEFEGTRDYGERAGDVKYHMGFSSDMNTPGGAIHVALAFNPSHLEIVGPVVEGSVRARQDRRNDITGDKVLPVIIHGDASFAGQGVVMETLNMSNTRGFTTRGTIHIIINNQIGFTTSTSQDSRSTYYCSDVAKMVNAPIFHVNGDDPEAVVFTTQMALDFRERFHKDVVIDLFSYRRQGHNEADEPAVTQPLMYKIIRSLPTTRALYAQRLMNDKVITEKKADDQIAACRARLEKGEPVVPHILEETTVLSQYPIDWKRFVGHHWETIVPTNVSVEHLQEYAAKLNEIPEQFELHPRVEKILQARRQMAAGKQPLDWGFAETMAYATLLKEGFPVRLCGQDSGRGTFFHRHAVLHHQQRNDVWIPLKHFSKEQAHFTIVDSLLSEEAVLAFEYGYATTEPDSLVIWEAQFGDFANGAQVVIDQFISSGEQKWGRLSGLVMLLPHGYEGQGAEHSSARLERYLQLCAERNMQVCVPTTPAQMFHLLRRQMLRPYRKPLIVMTPKSLLRHPLAVSSLEDLSSHNFYPIHAEHEPHKPENIKRIVLCSGKVYYDLLQKRQEEKRKDVILLRIEQLYPFPERHLRELLAPYNQVEEYVWCQEEPLNQGAWDYVMHRLHAILGEDVYLQPVARPPSAAPAVGSLRVHIEQQKALVEAALD